MVQIQQLAEEKKLNETIAHVSCIDVINDKSFNFQINCYNLSNE